MSRDLFTGLSNALDDQVMQPFFALRLEFDSGDVNVWTGYGTIKLNGINYIGAGNLLTISPVEESSTLAVPGLGVTLTGISSDILAIALDETYQGRVGTLYFGILDDTSDVVEVFSGFIDQMNIEDAGETATVTLNIENKLIRLERPVPRRYTNQDQRNRFPGDTGLSFIESIQNDRTFSWGAKANR